jgi:hypothetical protein
MDSRFELDVKFEIYGEKYEWNCSLNWSAESGRIDERIHDWFLECHDKAYSKWELKNFEYRADKEKELEIQQLKRLKEKYPEI